MKPSTTTYPEYFQRYINQVKEDDLKLAFKTQMPTAEIFFQSISEEFSLRRYAEDKWTIREVLQHVIDAERVFSYRALCFARKEQSILPSFDENSYTINSHANDRLWNEMIEEFTASRKSSEYLFNSFSDDALNTIGKASDYTISVAALGFITVGHVEHHIRIIKERYIGV
ncbi:DinB family protein [Ginsengibacter hankyongi]|uniref:DinB family protein n=1 Tax=Ginsengibacter hankyongi TaxID=2607284 RepID=A0A5J5IB66_9BACT|nr:DinB family protein [Ginsengibacter hankyongi]KAA9034348.1 DinB family protein [Ginsengibacter hankyongi]